MGNPVRVDNSRLADAMPATAAAATTPTITMAGAKRAHITAITTATKTTTDNSHLSARTIDLVVATQDHAIAAHASTDRSMPFGQANRLTERR